jgi:hypothetical protein
MAGLAAALNAPTSIDAIAWALHARGADGAVCRLTGAGGAILDVAVRAAMPTITRVVPAEEPNQPASDRAPRPVAAVIVDGIASVTALDLAYAERGPAALVDGGEAPYAVVLADAERDELVLARNGAGPGLYYARLDRGWVVASEPAALVHAGVPAEPDVAVIRRFIQTGACDDSDRTFFAGIRRVLPGEAVVLGTATAGPVRHPARPVESETPPVDQAIWRAAADGRVAVLVAPGVAGAAVLGACLHQPGRPRPLPAFTARVGGIEGPAAQAPAVLGSLGQDTVRPTTVTLDLSTVDRFLRDMGEPVPDLGHYLLWTVAREVGADVDTLVDAFPGSVAGWDRVADRLLAHCGVTVRSPLRGPVPDHTTLTALANRTLPPLAVRNALADRAQLVTAAQVVLALRDEVGASLVPPRPWSDAAASVTTLRRLIAGESVDAEALLRAFLVERWLAGFGPQATVTEVVAVEEAPQLPLRQPDAVVVGDEEWRRTPVRTAPIAPGDQLLANTAFYVVNALTASGEQPSGPWFAVVSGKVVAVSQRRVRPVDEVRPSRLARLLTLLVRRRRPHLADPRVMQTAIDHSGRLRMLGTVLFGGSLPRQAAVYPPRADAMTPADSCVVRPPWQPDEVAASLLAAMRLALQPEYGRRLAGVAIASADDLGCRVLGFAPGPAVAEVPRPRAVLSLVLADNPAGQGLERTPIVVVTRRSPMTLPMRRSPVVDEEATRRLPASTR